MTYRDPEKAKAYRAAWLKRNPWLTKAINANRRAKLLGVEGRLSSADVRAVLEAGTTCVYCGTAGNPSGTRAERLTIDHIVAMTKGGANTRENLQVACGRCNARKFNGNRPGWSSHHDECVVCGATDTPHGGLGRCERCYARLRYVPVAREAAA